MAIEISEDATSEQVRVTFTVLDDGTGAQVSVVGSFNDWVAGKDPLFAREDGRLGVTITLSSDDDVHFRYLREGGIWFDDDDADEVTSFGSVIRSPRGRLGSADPARADAALASAEAEEEPSPANDAAGVSSKTRPAATS
jgi:hypothetical protein